MIFGLVLILRHSKEIGRLIDRIKSIGKGGLATTDSTALATTQEEVREAPAKPSAADELLKSFDNQLLVDQEKIITDFLNEQNVHSPSERERVLT